MSNTVNNSRSLKPKQRLAIHYLVSGKSITETARLVGVTRQTIANWLNLPLFSDELDKSKEKMYRELATMHLPAAKRAFEIREKIMEDETADKADRLRAAEAINKESHRLREMLVYEERLAKLEKFAEDYARNK